MNKNKITQKEQRNNNIYNIYTFLFTSFICALTGFGVFWGSVLVDYNIFFSIFMGMMFSSLMFCPIKKMYPVRK